ncbi:hypothetical protein MLD38_004599 [Melastoma candidum]|uniref:Uncharacterized protein n=1 Tax=Melastoma candidum TaxID=119954 RepID=A0ACB9SAW0_9MYRT|nr:hypothetical protein MLD38_004599 [Melastoma candidum]
MRIPNWTCGGRHSRRSSRLPEARLYFLSSLYIRCVVSPTAIMVRIARTDRTNGGISTGSRVSCRETSAKDIVRTVHVGGVTSPTLGEQSLPDYDTTSTPTYDTMVQGDSCHLTMRWTLSRTTVPAPYIV